ncbi:MAG: FecR domain-containing protein [Bdellovibrionales bacterium]|nr:FecR domain-containing protein [Bdellovibrionales bacterium]
MGRYTKRLIIALFFSMTCYGATEYWYISTRKVRKIDSSKPPIATLIESENQVQRKPISRIIWESISLNEALYAGESIRTSNNSQAKIKFENTGTIIELEPESLIVLEESKGKVTLNFLKGNIFLNNESKNKQSGNDLTIKAGKSEIRATASTNLNLSGNSDEGVNLDVFKGAATLTSEKGKELTVDKTKSGELTKGGVLNVKKEKFEILSPQANDRYYVDPENRKPLTINWKNLPEGYTVQLFVGERRSKLYKVNLPVVAGESGKLSFKPKVGKFYWKLLASPKEATKSSSKIKSKIFPITVIAKIPPTLIYPKKDQQIVLDDENKEVKIKWANTAQLEDLTLQVATDKNLNNLIIKAKSLNNKITVDSLEISQPGDYFWRIIGYMDINGKLEPISSPIQKFTLNIVEELKPPRPKSPSYDQNILFSKFLKDGATLSWTKMPGISDYKVMLTKVDNNGTTFEPQYYEVSDVILKLTQLDAGSYYWSVASVNKRGETSAYSKQMRFNLKDLPRIEWALDSEEEGVYYFMTARPSIRLKWTIDNEKIVSYRVKYSRDLNGKTIQSKWKTTTTKEFNSYLPTTGLFEFIVEGITLSGKIGARSLPLNLMLKKRDILPAPTFAKSVPLKILSEKNGNFQIQWNPVKGATKYTVQLKDKNGQVIHEYNFESTSGTVKNLNPGKYDISVASVDQFDRKGLSSENREVTVPNSSNIQAPKLKGIKVK